MIIEFLEKHNLPKCPLQTLKEGQGMLEEGEAGYWGRWMPEVGSNGIECQGCGGYIYAHLSVCCILESIENLFQSHCFPSLFINRTPDYAIGLQGLRGKQCKCSSGNRRGSVGLCKLDDLLLSQVSAEFHTFSRRAYQSPLSLC